ncbi:MAG TPA: hypothetical protein VI913_00585 [Candidatus Peribacteraceae bacterium]|nr:hypothetical protein [Candidatus Peribacteraceae bacterium]
MILRALKRLFKREETPKTDFSEFFVSASTKEKEKLLRQVIKDANKDQRELIKRYDKAFPNTV